MEAPVSRTGISLLFLEWHKSGLLDLNALVTQRFTLDQVNEAVAALEAGHIQGRAILEF